MYGPGYFTAGIEKIHAMVGGRDRLHGCVVAWLENLVLEAPLRSRYHGLISEKTADLAVSLLHRLPENHFQGDDGGGIQLGKGDYQRRGVGAVSD